ncbi:uncharacterized protein A4U43_C04F17080 [Asparagus officinalis]|uniref:Uncharacterized protein n=1 Tax=Asparagus officinalis TaxID=4686 RepID=A0A5P1F663_ASPOF|nr:uncharacterized protein A4U43_C04F17080 [Asparagus officinalis]
MMAGLDLGTASRYIHQLHHHPDLQLQQQHHNPSDFDDDNNNNNNNQFSGSGDADGSSSGHQGLELIASGGGGQATCVGDASEGAPAGLQEQAENLHRRPPRGATNACQYFLRAEARGSSGGGNVVGAPVRLAGPRYRRSRRRLRMWRYERLPLSEEEAPQLQNAAAYGGAGGIWWRRRSGGGGGAETRSRIRHRRIAASSQFSR